MQTLWFSFAGENSWQDHGVRILSRPTIPTPSRRFQAIAIPGRSSAIWYDDGTLDDFSIQVSCGLVLPPGAGETELLARFRQVESWLYGTMEGELSFSFEPETTHQARVNGPLELDVRMRRLGQFAIPFLCRPPLSAGEE